MGALRVVKNLRLRHADSEDSDQTEWMSRLVRGFAERSCHFIGFVVLRLIRLCLDGDEKVFLWIVWL